MDTLILKPTEKCNFKCTFCSSTKIADDNTDVLDLEQVFRTLERFPSMQTIVINGGDPLMMEPDYYWKIIDWLDERDYNTNISMTSNLWPFYKKPKKWAPLFNHWRIGVTTSFQYGPGRLKGDSSLFTEGDLWRVSDTMLEYVGYRPDFIGVITEWNEEFALKNVELARKMSDDLPPVGTDYDIFNTAFEKTGVECKLNYAMASGDQDAPYRLSKIYDIYVKIYEADLHPWEYHTKQMMRRLKGERTSCPQIRTCDSGMRTLQPSGDYYSCGAFGDDREKAIDWEKEMSSKSIETPLSKSVELHSLKKSCYTCPMFEICNGCYKTVKDLKQHNMVEDHCKQMKELAPKIININGVNREVTPYINEGVL